MRISLILAAIFFASTAAAQQIQPLPQSLVPSAVSAEAPVGPTVENGMLTGALVGATVGGLYGAFFARECGVETDCDLSRGMKTVTFITIGGALGTVIGAATSFMLGWRGAQPPSDLRVAPDADGRMTVGVSLRH
jgi:hypothetical protein